MNTENGLIGLYFHTFDENNIVGWQGHIASRPEPGWYVVQLYSWALGYPTDLMLVRIEDMKDWIFYDDIEDWRAKGTELTNHADKQINETIKL